MADNSGLRVGDDIYQSIGVRPIINARGTYTIISGSVMLPEVRAALDAAAQHYVHLDELADAIGAQAGHADRRRVGSRHVRMRGRPHARDGGLRRRRQSRPARADPEPGRLPA